MEQIGFGENNTVPTNNGTGGLTGGEQAVYGAGGLIALYYMEPSA